MGLKNYRFPPGECLCTMPERCASNAREIEEGGFSLERTTVLIAPNRGGRPLRHICTISLSSMLTLIEPRELLSSLIFKVYNLESTCPFVGYYSALGGVEVYVLFCSPKLPSASWPLEYNRTCDHEHMMPNNIPHNFLVAPTLGSWRVLGWVEILVLLQYNSNSLVRQGIGASCIPKMQSCFYLTSR